MSYEGSQYEIINLGNNHTVTLVEMIRRLEEALGIPARIEWLPEHAGDVPQTGANIEKARTLLRYESRTKFEEGVDRFVDWFRLTQRMEAIGRK